MKKYWLVLFIISTLLLSGCGKTDVEKKTEVEKKTGKYEYTNEKSEGSAEVGENVKLPSDFPEDIPIYKAATVTSHINNKSDKAEMTTVTLQTTDDLKKVGSFYEEELANNGFEQQGGFETDKSTSFTAKKGKITVIVAINRNDGKTTVGINISTRLE